MMRKNIYLKTILSVCFCFIGLLFFTGCGSKQRTLNEIKADLSNSGFIEENIGRDDNYSISDISLIKRDTQESSDEVYCTITVESDAISIVQDYKLIYNFYSTGGWILDGYIATSEGMVYPLKGVDDAVVDVSMEEQVEHTYDYKIEGHDTDLESMTDKVNVSVSNNGNIFQASGTLYLYYNFNGSVWELTNIEKSDDYSEYWDVDGTWILNEPEYTKLTVIQLWHSNDMTLHGNYYVGFYDEGIENFEFSDEYENTDVIIDMRLNIMLFDSQECSIDYNNIYDYYGYEDNTAPMFQKVSSDIINRNEFWKLASGEGSVNSMENKDDALKNSNNTEENLSKLSDSYSRTNGPKCGLSIWSADENGISFSIGIGESGYLAYVDMRSYIAEWTGSDIAVYKDDYNNYQLTFQINDDGSITLKENASYSEDFWLSGDYIPNSIAGQSCEYVFSNSDNVLINSSELEGKTAMECKIARNEIYARHGRLFQDEALQGYFNDCSWYTGTITAEDFSDNLLNEVEKANLQIISEYENKINN